MPQTDDRPAARHEVTPLYDEAMIAARIEGLARDIAATLRPEAPLLVIALLKGAIPFSVDLCRALSRAGLALEISYASARSYQGMQAKGPPRLEIDLSPALEGRHILVLDDILDTGATLDAVIGALKVLHPAAIKSCVLLDKTVRRRIAIEADFVGFPCPDAFVVGYGMDLDGLFRELPFIGTLRTVSG